MLLRSLAPLIGAEEEAGEAVGPGWADNVSKEKIDGWHNAGVAHTEPIETEIKEIVEKHYHEIMFKVRKMISPRL